MNLFLFIRNIHWNVVLKDVFFSNMSFEITGAAYLQVCLIRNCFQGNHDLHFSYNFYAKNVIYFIVQSCKLLENKLIEISCVRLLM